MPVPAGLSIVIPHKDQPETLAPLLESIRTHALPGFPLEIWVMDDHSAHRPETLCAAKKAHCVPVSGGLGPAHARNQGVAQAQYAWILFLDADVLVPPGFFERIVHALEALPEMDALSFINQPYAADDPTVRNYGAVLEYYWFTGNFAEDEVYAPLRGLTTRNGLVRKAAFEAIQGFDTRFTTNAHEDFDFGKRLTQAHTAYLCRDPLPYHRFPASFTRLVRNYWVRINLFVPYYRAHRPALDKTQTSPREALLRITGLSSLGWLGLALAPFPGKPLWLAFFLLAALLYLTGVRRFLTLAHSLSRSWGFTLACLAIHYATSLVIATGGLWAAIRPARSG